MMAKLHNQQGITLLETLATAAVIAFAIISIYIGVIYADKQVQRNYHDRVATLIASGEVDWQYYYFKNYKEFSVYPSRPVVIDRLDKGRLLNGTMSTRVENTYETPFGLTVPYTILEVSVAWMEPGDKSLRKVVVREDFY